MGDEEEEKKEQQQQQQNTAQQKEKRIDDLVLHTVANSLDTNACAANQRSTKTNQQHTARETAKSPDHVKILTL